MHTAPAPDRARPLYEDPSIESRRWFLLAMMCLSLVLVVMSVSGLVTAIPTMQEELNASASQIQWILDAYAIVFAGSLLTAGSLGDRFGRKRALLTGILVFGFGALVRRRRVERGAGDRRTRGDGDRRRLRDAGDLVDHHDDLLARGAITRHCRVGRLRRSGRRHRTDHLRRAAPAVLVGVRGARQLAARRVDVHRHLDLRPRVPRRDEDTARPGRRGALTRRPGLVGVRDHPRRRRRLDVHVRWSARRRSHWSRSPRSSNGSAVARIRCFR